MNIEGLPPTRRLSCSTSTRQRSLRYPLWSRPSPRWFGPGGASHEQQTFGRCRRLSPPWLHTARRLSEVQTGVRARPDRSCRTLPNQGLVTADGVGRTQAALLELWIETGPMRPRLLRRKLTAKSLAKRVDGQIVFRLETFDWVCSCLIMKFVPKRARPKRCFCLRLL